MRYGAARMSGWKSLFWFALGMAGVGFAGYVYLVPYRKMQTAAGGRTAELAAEHNAAETAKAEREKLKAELVKCTGTLKEKAAADSKRKASIETMAAQLKPGLEELGATIVADDGVLQVSFPSAKMIDANGIDVSDGGLAALKILAGAAKKESAKARIYARSSAAAPPKALKGLFRTAGEMNAVRAARMLSSLQGAGMAPGRVSIVGQAASAGPRGKGKKAAAPAADRVELELEPE
jgi:hypothetical protein